MSSLIRLSLLLGLLLVGDCVSPARRDVFSDIRTAIVGNLTKVYGDAVKDIDKITSTVKNTTTKIIHDSEYFVLSIWEIFFSS